MAIERKQIREEEELKSAPGRHDDNINDYVNNNSRSLSAPSSLDFPLHFKKKTYNRI